MTYYNIEEKTQLYKTNLVFLKNVETIEKQKKLAFSLIILSAQ